MKMHGPKTQKNKGKLNKIPLEFSIGLF